MQDARAIRERLTAMLELSDEGLIEAGVVVTRESVALSVLAERGARQGQIDSQITSRTINTTGPLGKACRLTQVLDVGGTSHTGDDGSVEFRLSDFHCTEVASVERPINFVATPQARVPVYLTSRQVPVDAQGFEDADVLITVWSWNSSGAPAPGVSFDWRCFVPMAEPID